jgi:hypothetical protein
LSGTRLDRFFPDDFRYPNLLRQLLRRKDEIVRVDPNERNPFLLDTSLTQCVIGLSANMGIAIDLDGQLEFVAIKVEDVPPDHMLTSEFQAEQPTIPQNAPSNVFRGRRKLAMVSGETLFAVCE